MGVSFVRKNRRISAMPERGFASYAIARSFPETSTPREAAPVSDEQAENLGRLYDRRQVRALVHSMSLLRIWPETHCGDPKVQAEHPCVGRAGGGYQGGCAASLAREGSGERRDEGGFISELVSLTREPCVRDLRRVREQSGILEGGFGDDRLDPVLERTHPHPRVQRDPVVRDALARHRRCPVTTVNRPDVKMDGMRELVVGRRWVGVQLLLETSEGPHHRERLLDHVHAVRVLGRVTG